MVLLSLLLDLIAAGSYWLQLTMHSTALYWVGTLAQLIFVIILIVFTIGYQGRRHERHDYTLKGYRYQTIPYSIIVLSMVLNALLLFLYALNIFGGNNIVFGG